MKTEKKTITIDEDLCRLIEKHNEENGSSFSGVIRIALKKFFNKNKKQNK